MEVKVFYFNMFRECTYVVYDPTGEATIIDAGCSTAQEKERLRSFLETHHLTPKLHLLTHGHLDHLLGAQFLYQQYGLLPHLSPLDEPLFRIQEDQERAFECQMEDQPLTDFLPLQDQERLHCGDFEIQVIATPGHSQGGLSYYIEALPHPLLFTGDTLFRQDVGRCDLMGGDQRALLQSLHTRILPLPDDTMIYPGHGIETVLQDEKLYNPYLQ